MNLKHLTDKTLLSETLSLAKSEREITLKILHHLKEIDSRKLFSDIGHKSLFDYCVYELGYSAASAQRRIVSCRLLAEIPSIEMHVESGDLNLTTLSHLAQFFKDEEIKDPHRKQQVIKEVQGLSRRECDLKLIELSTNPIERKHCLWINDSTMEKIKDYRALKGTHESYEDIVSEALTAAYAELEATKFKLVKHPRKPTASDARTPTASVKREVFLRDKQCVKCGSKFGLEFDHQHPYALGGKSTPENIRLLCRNCNQRERIRQRL